MNVRPLALALRDAEGLGWRKKIFGPKRYSNKNIRTVTHLLAVSRITDPSGRAV